MFYMSKRSVVSLERIIRGHKYHTYRTRRAHIPRLSRINWSNARNCLIFKGLQMYKGLQMPNHLVDQTSLYSFKQCCAAYIKSIIQTLF